MEQVFKPSINIKYDFNANSILDYYIPTPTHIESINMICQSVINPKYTNNHIIIGAYGTGKSLLGLLLANLVSKKFTSNELDYLKKAFSKYDDSISQNISQLKSVNLKYLPVFINGNEGSLQHAILSNTYQVLKENNLNVIFNDKKEQIFDAINGWEEKFPKTYEQFKQLLMDYGKTLKIFNSEIEANNEETMELFETLYPQLSSGATFNYNHNDNFITQIESILSQLNEQGYGLIFIYDEFGRFLQTIPEDKTYLTMQYLQDLAELLDHGVKNAQLVLISHKDMRQYFDENSKFRDEFQRIEKRFKKCYINSNNNMFLSIAENIISKTRKSHIDAFELEAHLNQLRKFPIFNLNRTELQSLVVEGCYPIHPVTLSLLPALSNVFGQNERTLFTFLDCADTNGLKYFINNESGYYVASNLFDYFFPDLKSLSQVEEKHPLLKTYLKNKGKIPQNKNIVQYDKMINILKFITLWQLTNMNSIQSLSSEFIAYSQNSDITEIESLLSKLQAFRVIRFNRLYSQWEIYEGSSIDIDKEIQNKIFNLSLTDAVICQLIESKLDKCFITADRYNLTKKMIRFATIHLFIDEQIMKEDLTYKFSCQDSDARINIIIPTSHDIENLEVKVKALQNKFTNNIFVIYNKLLEIFEKDVKKYYAIQSLLENHTLLGEDAFVKTELNIELQETDYYLKQLINKLTMFPSESKWFIPNYDHEIYIQNELQIKNILSDMFFREYPYTPMINNEAFNRRNIANVQKNASKKVIDAILTNPNEDNYGITGFGPDYLIFATTFKNNGIISSKQLETIEDINLIELKKALTNKIQTSSAFGDLVEILRSKPFGIREPLIPVLLVGLLQDIWSNMMFFNKGQYISRVTSEQLCEMVMNSEGVTYQVNNFNDEDFEFFNQILTVFNQHISEHVKDKAIQIKASSALLGWLQSLPRFTQISSAQSDELLLFKTYIRRLEVDPTDSLSWLKAHSQQLSTYKGLLENWFEEKIESIYDEIIHENQLTNLYDWAKEKLEQNKDNKFIKDVLSCNHDKCTDLLNDLSYVLFEFYATDWTDNFTQTFISEMKNKIDAVNQTQFDPNKYVTLKLNDETKYIMKTELTPRAKTLYDNLQRMITNSGKRITNNELEYILYSIIEQKLEIGEEA